MVKQALVRLTSSLALRDFRLLWFYHVLNFVGGMMLLLAQGWLVLELTGSAFWVGAVAGASGVAQVTLGIFGGTLADRLSRRGLLIVAQLVRGLGAAIVAVLILLGLIEIWHLMLLAVLMGGMFAVSLPAGEALIYDTVGPDRLLNAVTVKMGAFNVGRIPASLAAGWMLSTMSPGYLFLVVGAIFALSAVPIVFLRTHYHQDSLAGSVWKNVVEGVQFAARSPAIRSLLLFSITMEACAFSYHIMLPVIAKDVLGLGAFELGVLSAAGAVGGITATIVLASWGDVRNKMLLMAAASSFSGVMLVLLGMSPLFGLSLVLVALIGGGLVTYDSAMGTLMQILSGQAMRGRILGLYGLTWGFNPVGGTIAGAIATVAGAPLAVAIGGLLVLTAVGVVLVPNRVLWRPAVSPDRAPVPAQV